MHVGEYGLFLDNLSQKDICVLTTSVEGIVIGIERGCP